MRHYLTPEVLSVSIRSLSVDGHQNSWLNGIHQSLQVRDGGVTGGVVMQQRNIRCFQ